MRFHLLLSFASSSTVLHPKVEEDIDSDLELMRLAAYYLNKWKAFKGFKYLNMDGAIDEFASLLMLQLDLRIEAANLVRFNENFANFDEITFPKVSEEWVHFKHRHPGLSDSVTLVFICQLIEGYKPTKDVLIMTFCDGIPVLQFTRENKEHPELLRKMCHIGIRSICKMIFEDNFLHGTPSSCMQLILRYCAYLN